MKELLQNLETTTLDKIANATSLQELDVVRVEVLGKKGSLVEILKGLKDLDIEEKKQVGMSANKVKGALESAIDNKKKELEKLQMEKEIANTPKIDISLPVDENIGSLHPITVVSRDIERIFTSMGFNIEDGLEVESEYHNFEALNIPDTHPARDMQDTFWLENHQLLKTHTSAAQNSIMKKYGAPLKVIFPGRCFRNEALDASHENTFFQMEGMMIDKDISVANLIYFMKTILSEIFEREVDVRLRPGFFPFVEPGFELDVSCPYCGGTGCKVCKQGGWIELCPCGLIHPNVLKAGGIDPEEYSGFAFGLGLARLAMMKYNIDDLRVLNSGDLRALKQIGTK